MRSASRLRRRHLARSRTRAASCNSHREAPGAPRGIALSLDALDANLTSMFGWLEPRAGAVVCSWLPLSHDMGLIGLALYAICSVNPPWSVPTDLVLMTPESFMADPRSWMRACSDYRATSTTAPPFALRLASRVLRSSGSFDLSSLRSFVVGSEPVPADGLREFEAMGRDFGLSPHALCPGYGLAEAALAVAIDPTTSPWSSVRVDSDALAAANGAKSPTAGLSLSRAVLPSPTRRCGRAGSRRWANSRSGPRPCSTATSGTGHHR